MWGCFGLGQLFCVRLEGFDGVLNGGVLEKRGDWGKEWRMLVL